MDESLFKRLIDYKEGDVISRTELLAELDIPFQQWISKKQSLSPFLEKLNLYMQNLSYRESIGDFFHSLGQFLTLLFDKTLDKKEKSQKLRGLSKKLTALMQSKSEEDQVFEVPFSRESSDFSFTFSEKDEKELDYSSIVISQNIVDTYVDEVGEFLDDSQAALLDLEHDPANEEAINQVFRCFHTIKSSSAFLGFKNIEVLSHYMENMLGKVRSKEMRMQPELVDVIFHGMGLIRDLTEVVKNSSYNAEDMISGFNSYTLSPYIHLVEKISEQFKNRRLGEILQEMGRLDKGALEGLLKKQENQNRILGDLAVEEKLIDQEDLQRALAEQNTQRSRQSFVRVNSQRLNQLVDMVGELVVNQSMIRQKLLDPQTELEEQDVNQLEEITSAIKDIALSMGMTPMQELFQKLRIIVRNTAKDLGRMVSFDITGGDTEMDRTLVESIYDPLVHMVRNSVSHGIEDPDKRKQKGKAPVGHVAISAQYRGNGIEIEVADDGGGIDPEKVVEKALSMGILKEEERDAVIHDKDRCFSLLFHPGFSTKDKADSISGRGVGMDVVMQNISRINGKVEVESTLGQGSLFRIKLPLTLAIIDGFVTEINGEFFVFPFEDIEEILVPEEVKLIPMEEDSPMIFSRDRYFPYVDFNCLLTGKEGSYGDQSVYIRIRHDDTDMAIPVNRVLGKQEIVIKNLNELIRHQRLFYGGTIFGDGSIGFILDLDEVIRQYREQKGPEGPPVQEVDHEEKRS